MMKFLGAAAIAASLIAGPVLAQGSMTAPAADAKAGISVSTPALKAETKAGAKVAVDKPRQKVVHKHVVRKHVAHKRVLKKHTVQHVKHVKTVKRVKHPVAKNVAG